MEQWKSDDSAFQTRNQKSQIGHPIVRFQNSLLFPVGISLDDGLFDLFDRQALLVHVPGIERDVFTKIATGAVSIGEAEKIVLVPIVQHTATETGQLFEDLGNVLRHLVCSLGFGVAGELGR